MLITTFIKRRELLKPIKKVKKFCQSKNVYNPLIKELIIIN